MRRVRLGDVCQVISGATPKKGNPAFWGGEIPWVTPAELDDDTHLICKTERCLTEAGFKSASLHMMPAGTVLLSTRAPIGKTAITGIEMCCNQGFKNLVCGDEIDNEYLYRFLKSSTAELQARGRGATFKELSKREVERFLIPLPPLERQHECTSKLEAVEGEITEARGQLTKLDELAKSQFVEMFGNPVENPFEWEVKPLGELGTLKNGVNFKSVEAGTEIRCLGVGDFKNRYQIRNMESISAVSLNGKPNANQLLRDGDIVFVRSNGNKQLVGRCLAVFPGDEDVTFSGFCIRFRNESEKLLLDYLLGCLKSDSMRNTMTGRGANIQNLNQKLLAGIGIPIPPLPLQQEFAAFVTQVDQLKADTQMAIDKLQTLYDSLAQEYFSE